MLTRHPLNVFMLAGLALAGLVGVIALLTIGWRRKRAATVSAVALTALLCAGFFWASKALSPYQLDQPAPVDSALTIYYSGQACSGSWFNASPCDSQHALYALRARDGTVRWRRPTPDPTYFEWSSPILRNGVLYVSSADTHTESGGVVAAIRASDGAEIWQVDRPVLGTLWISGDNLSPVTSHLVSSAPSQTATQLDTLRLSDGATVRSVLLPPGDGRLALDGSAVYRCESDGALVALRLSDAHQVWRTEVNTPSTSTAANSACVSTVVDGVVYVQTGAPSYPNASTDSSIVAVRASDGYVLWRYHIGPSAPLTMSNGTIFTIAYTATSPNRTGAQRPSSSEYVAVALRASDGSRLWQRSLGTLARNAGTITAGSGAVYVGLLGSLLALRAADGAILWRRQEASNRSFSVLAALSDVVFVQSNFVGSGFASENGFPLPYLLALRASDGALYWRAGGDAHGGLEVGAL